MATLSKMEIVNSLADALGYRRYLEICTSTTGFCYAQLDRSRYNNYHRLMYNCPEDYSDGLPIDFRSPTFEISECLKQIEARNLRFDVILVDPYHAYDTSRRDLEAAFGLIVEGGRLVVHDCLPCEGGAVVSPTFIPGLWCGVTYKAYIDFVSDRDDLEYTTVDTDMGCGIVYKLRRSERLRHKFLRWFPGNSSSVDSAASRKQKALLETWRQLGDDFDAVYRFFDVHKALLLKLTSPENFLPSQRHKTEGA
jgi:hypothetical protein